MQSGLENRLSRLMTSILFISLAGCQVTFVTAYDDTFDQEVTSTQKDVDALMSEIAANSTQPYASFSSDYAKVGTDLDALEVRAGSHTSNTDTVNSVGRIQHTFVEFQTEHANPQTPISSTHARDELSIMNHEFQILMAQELAKKSGQK